MQWRFLAVNFYPHCTYGCNLDHNYCRNPAGSRPQPWCYTIGDSPGSLQEEYCVLKRCPENLFPQIRKLEKGKHIYDESGCTYRE